MTAAIKPASVADPKAESAYYLKRSFGGG